MKVTVCQLRSEPAGLVADWEKLVNHVEHARSDLVLLPEMPFYPWPFWQRRFHEATWQASLAAHDEWQERLSALHPAVVLASRPVGASTRRLNEGFYWQDGTYCRAHHKYYLPDESGFWEASWYERGDGRFIPTTIAMTEGQKLYVGFLVCTELWFMRQARAYGQAGVHLLATPRATEKHTVDKWLAGGRAAAVIAGAFSLSSNHFSRSERPVPLGGQGWVIDPDGDVLALTTPQEPFATVEIDPNAAERAKQTYPRYVLD